MSTDRIPFFVITFYADPDAETFHVSFDYNGPALAVFEDDELAELCSDSAIKARAVLECMFEEPHVLIKRFDDTSSNFRWKDDNGGH